ncbi:geranylgeranyl transferase type-2 subunit alpha-like, partial [Argonauta hians]
FDKRSNGVFDEKGLGLCGEVLLVNPDFYTLWNFRKEILLSFKEHRPEDELQRLYEEEMSFTEACLKVNPKSYGCWDHRIFIQNNVPRPNWSRELELCNKFLEYDERNFHCWDYRRFVVQQSANTTTTTNTTNTNTAAQPCITLQDEFDFTTTKISSNFSNYSSWHYRSKLLPQLRPDPTQAAGTEEEALLQEFDIVQNAIFTDPDDQSAWFYHRWLMGRGRIEPEFLHVVFSPTNNTLSISVTKPIHPTDGDEKVTVSINDQPVNPSTTQWYNPFHTDYHSPVWTLDLPPQLLVDESRDTPLVISVHLHTDADPTTPAASCSLTVKELVERICYRPPGLKPSAVFNSQLSAAKTTILEKDLEALKELLVLESENKWALLTAVQLMQALDSVQHSADINNYLHTLRHIDSKRDNYYRDYKSKVTMENKIKSLSGRESRVEIPGQQLTALYHQEHLLPVQHLNLSDNHICHLHSLAYLTSLLNINLDRNQVSCVDGLGALPGLVSLSLRHNCLTRVDDLRPLQSCAALKELNIEGNSVTLDDPEYRASLKQLLPQLTLIDGVTLE